MSARRLYALILLLCLFFVSCGTDGVALSETGINSISFHAGAEEFMLMDVGDSIKGHIKVEGNDEYDLSDIVFVTTDPNVASFEYDKTMLTNYVYYTIESLSAGETVIYVKTVDGMVSSKSVKITVKDKDPATKLPETDTPDSSDLSNEGAYILNTNTKKYHKESCRHVKNIKEENKKSFFGTVEELMTMGYEACQNCYDVR